MAVYFTQTPVSAPVDPSRTSMTLAQVNAAVTGQSDVPLSNFTIADAGYNALDLRGSSNITLSNWDMTNGFVLMDSTTSGTITLQDFYVDADYENDGRYSGAPGPSADVGTAIYIGNATATVLIQNGVVTHGRANIRCQGFAGTSLTVQDMTLYNPRGENTAIPLPRGQQFQSWNQGGTENSGTLNLTRIRTLAEFGIESPEPAVEDHFNISEWGSGDVTVTDCYAKGGISGSGTGFMVEHDQVNGITYSGITCEDTGPVGMGFVGGSSAADEHFLTDIFILIRESASNPASNVGLYVWDIWGDFPGAAITVELQPSSGGGPEGENRIYATNSAGADNPLWEGPDGDLVDFTGGEANLDDWGGEDEFTTWGGNVPDRGLPLVPATSGWTPPSGSELE